LYGSACVDVSDPVGRDERYAPCWGGRSRIAESLCHHRELVSPQSLCHHGGRGGTQRKEEAAAMSYGPRPVAWAHSSQLMAHSPQLAMKETARRRCVSSPGRVILELFEMVRSSQASRLEPPQAIRRRAQPTRPRPTRANPAAAGAGTTTTLIQTSPSGFVLLYTFRPIS